MSVLLYLVGLIIIAGVAVSIAAPLLWLRPFAPSARPTDPERYRLEKEKELAYAAIKDAEFDLQMGKLSPEDHASLREKYEGKALAALEALERRG